MEPVKKGLSMSKVLKNLILFLTLISSEFCLSHPVNTGFKEGPGEESSTVGIVPNLKKIFGALPRTSTTNNPKLQWPLDDSRHVLLTRFGTPTLFDIPGVFRACYLHEAIDISRSSTNVSDLVLSPVSGLARVLYDADGDSTAEPYSTAVAIQDENSGLIVVLLHVNPNQKLVNDREFSRVTKGQAIGRLADFESQVKPEAKETFKHTHLMLLDLERETYSNPLNYMSGYVDTVPPTVKRAYIIDDKGNRHSQLVSGPVTIALEAFDRDDFSKMNFEISSIEYKVSSHDGRVNLTSDRCGLDELVSPLLPTSYPANQFLDLVASLPQANSDVFSFNTNAANSIRSFGYLITELRSSPTGCRIRNQSDRMLQIPNDINLITFDGVIYDSLGNRTPFKYRFSR